RLLRGPGAGGARLVRQPGHGRRRQSRVFCVCNEGGGDAMSSSEASGKRTFPVSLEFFPPKTPEGSAKLRTARQALYALKPEFCSVTYGAGGSTQEGTFGTV